MGTIRFKSGMVTLPRSEFERMKKMATEAATQELLKRNREVLEAASEDILRLLILTGSKALINLDCEVEFVYAFIDELADLQSRLNDELTLESLEKELDEFGITLIKEKL